VDRKRPRSTNLNHATPEPAARAVGFRNTPHIPYILSLFFPDYFEGPTEDPAAGLNTETFALNLESSSSRLQTAFSIRNLKSKICKFIKIVNNGTLF
jgi:hypothetical protein